MTMPANVEASLTDFFCGPILVLQGQSLPIWTERLSMKKNGIVAIPQAVGLGLKAIYDRGSPVV